jgi:hypothetical protein
MHIMEQARQLNCSIEEISGRNFGCYIVVSFFVRSMMDDYAGLSHDCSFDTCLFHLSFLLKQDSHVLSPWTHSLSLRIRENAV